MSAPDEEPAADTPASASATAKVEAELQPVIKDLPEPTQREIVRTFERMEQHFMAAVMPGAAAPVDPETAKIVVASIDRDNDNKFQFLSQKQRDEAARDERSHSLEMARLTQLVRPIVRAVITIAVVSVGAGLAFIAFGHEAVGSSLLSGVLGALLGYIGGGGSFSASGKH